MWIAAKPCLMMYFNNYFDFKIKEDNKGIKIFRPWDNTKCNNAQSSQRSEDAQDSTVSTTTEDKPDDGIKSNDVIQLKDDIESIKKDDDGAGIAFKKPEQNSSNKHRMENRSPQLLDTGTSTSFADYNLLLDSYPTYPEILHANLAHSLGLTPTDPLFLESLSQGYALEEYARVLSQEHEAKILSGRKQRPKKYKCPYCDVGFSNNGQLKGHIRIHTGERPFKCDEKNCGKTFTRNEELTRHKRIHSGLRPFPCTQCGKRFGRKDHLKKHSRTHMQPRGLYAVPVMLPFDTWTSTAAAYPYVPMFGY